MGLGYAAGFALAGILLCVALLVDFYRFEVDPARQEIKIRTLWGFSRQEDSLNLMSALGGSRAGSEAGAG